MSFFKYNFFLSEKIDSTLQTIPSYFLLDTINMYKYSSLFTTMKEVNQKKKTDVCLNEY